jgi:ATP-binding cassette subfamily F protein 3
MNEKLSVFEVIDYVAVGDVRSKIRDILGAFLFGGEAADKKVAVLSGGERTRLAMIKLLLEPVNLLILDEPTNHLDMRSKDVLKEALKEFDGTAIIVSHDREFLDGLVNKVYEFGDRKVREHLGGIYEFLERKKIETLHDLERKIQINSVPDIGTKLRQARQIPAGKISENGNIVSYEQRKEQQRRIKRLGKNITEYETKIEKLEIEMKTMEGLLITPEGASNVDLMWKHAELQKTISDAINEWTEATILLENYKNNIL